MMLRRNLVRLGKSSLVISLPKKWVERQNLKPGDEIVIFMEEPNGLRIVPLSKVKGDKEEPLIINIDKISDEGLLETIIVGSYVVGKDPLIVKSEIGIKSNHFKAIRKVINGIRGFEILHQEPKKLVIKSIIDASKFSPPELIDRMHSLLLSMVKYVERALVNKNREYLDEVVYGEDELDRIFLTSLRMLATTFRKADTCGKRESILNLALYHEVIEVLEMSADLLEELAKKIKMVFDDLVQKEFERKLLTNMLQEIRDNLSRAIQALMNQDITLANKAIATYMILRERYLGLEDKLSMSTKDVIMNVVLRDVVSRLLHILKLVKLIASLSIFRSVGNRKEIP